MSTMLDAVRRAAGLSKGQMVKRLMACPGVQISNTYARDMLGSGKLPKTQPQAKELVEKYIGAEFSEVLKALKIKANEIWNPEKEDNPMFKKVMLSQKAAAHFGLPRNPFELVNSADDVFMSTSHFYVMEVMRMTAQTSGFAAIFGQVGSGKTTVKIKLFDELRKDGRYHIITVKSPEKGRISAKVVLTAIIRDLTGEPDTKLTQGSVEVLTRRTEELLKVRRDKGEFCLLVIEDAQDLLPKTLKVLKRLWEIEDSFRRLLAIILIGQVEFIPKLNSHDVREVAERMTQAQLEPLDEKDLEGYINKRLLAVKANPAKIIAPEAIAALSKKLTISDVNGKTTSLAYPQQINNMMVKILNFAADGGFTTITPEVVAAA